jgi:transcriptional regulator with XRE-family HTH domain
VLPLWRAIDKISVVVSEAYRAAEAIPPSHMSLLRAGVPTVWRFGLCDNDDMAGATIGQRISAYRRRRGMSQAALAGLVGRSESWLSQVERGVRSVDRLSVLLDMATALHVEVEALTGRPWRFAPNGGTLISGLEQIRRVLSRYAYLADDVAPGQADVDDVRASVGQVHADYQAARYERVVGALPDLLSRADQLWIGVGRNNRGMTDSLVAHGMSVYQVVCALLRADRTEEAENLAVKMAERLTSNVRPGQPDLLSVAGALWLIGAVIAATGSTGPLAATWWCPVLWPLHGGRAAPNAWPRFDCTASAESGRTACAE